MSMHHQRMLQRYGLGRPGDVYSVVNCDPIFSPLMFASFFTQIGLGATAAGIASSITTAIAAGGGYQEFRL